MPQGRRVGSWWIVFVFLAVVAGPARAGAPPGPGEPPPPATAVRLDAPIVVDGALTEAAWQRPPGLSRFVQDEPTEGAAASDSTWVWFAYDDHALYVAARMWDAHPDSIVAPLFRRDDIGATDFAGVILDCFHDHRTGYEFVITPSSSVMDATTSNDGSEDASWDGVWSARARRDALGWTCELRIPFSQLRFTPGERQVWGVNFGRLVAHRGEKSFAVIRPRAEGGFESRFPHLVGIAGVRSRRTIEVIPYVTGKAEYLTHPPGDRFNDGSRFTAGAGGDLRTSLGSNLTLNATVNPDFGQVEVDPAVVNLSDVESFYDEKRPFFTENAAVFSFGTDGPNDGWNLNWPGPTHFYTRRIGRAPQGGVPEGTDFADVPMATHILGAAKVTGRPAPGWNLGVLQALTSRERARVWRNDAESRVEVEPLTYYGVLRGQHETREGRNGVGLLSTLAQRRFGDADRLADELNRGSLLAGLDGWHFFDRRKAWVVSGWGAMTRLDGTAERLQAVQRSSLHYFQRPDASYLGVEDATSLTGFGGRLALNKEAGNVIFNVATGMLDPGFDVSDMGYQSYADVINSHVVSGYRWTKENAWRSHGWLVGYAAANWDFGGERTWNTLGSSGQVTFVNHHTLDGDVSWNPEAVANRQTRGGPRMLRKPGAGFSLHHDSDKNRPLSTCTSLSVEVKPETDSYTWSVSPKLAWRPAPSVYLSFGPSYERNVVDAQYVTSVAAAGEVPADFGERRYVFARLDQTTVAAGIRLNVTLTPGLSLQTYVQPFISAGRYDDFKELARAGTYDFVHYGRDGGSSYDPATGTVTPAGGGTPFALGNPAFNYASLRGNVVLRWEYRPGAVFYLVWTQSREDEEELGDLRFGPSTRRLLDAPADDIFLAKLTYYLGL